MVTNASAFILQQRLCCRIWPGYRPSLRLPIEKNVILEAADFQVSSKNRVVAARDDLSPMSRNSKRRNRQADSQSGSA